MNSKQRRQQERKWKRVSTVFVGFVEEMLQEIIDGEATPEYHLEQCKELRELVEYA